MARSRYTLTSMFRAIFSPFVDAYRDEFARKIIAAPPKIEPTSLVPSTPALVVTPAPVPFGWASLDIDIPDVVPPVVLVNAKPVARRKATPRKPAKAMPTAERVTKPVPKRKPAKRLKTKRK